MRKIIIYVCLILFSNNLFSTEIHSSKKGGDWNNKESWLEKKIPNENDDVIIDGDIIINGFQKCKNLTFTSNGKLSLSDYKESSRLNVKEEINLKNGVIIIESKSILTARVFNNKENGIVQNSGTIEIGD